MDRKAYLLSSLKKQVLQLKTQLDHIDRHKKNQKAHHRFNSHIYDSSYLDKGVKKFPLQDKCRNIIDVINEKSTVGKVPKLSPFRKAEYQKTKQNFSAEKNNFQTERKHSPNPLTGQGYSQKKKGIKTAFPEKPIPKSQKKQSQRKHFSFCFY